MTTGLTFAYRITLGIVAFYAAFRFTKVDKATRVICLLIWLGMATECFGYYTAKNFGTNYPVFNIAFFFEFALIALYYNYSITVLKKRNLGIHFAIAGVLLGIMNTFFFQPLLTTINSNLLFLECLMVLCLSMFSIYKMLTKEIEYLQLHRKVHFWLPCILLFYQAATLSSWGLYDKLGDSEQEKAMALDVIVLSINIITYLCYGALLLYYPKLKLLVDEP